MTNSLSDEHWIKHIRKLAKQNANYQTEARTLRMQVTALQDDVDHYKREFARQNARLLELSIQMEVDRGRLSGGSSPPVDDESKSKET